MTNPHELASAPVGKPDHQYGNRSRIEVVRLAPTIGTMALDPHGSLNHDTTDAPLFTEAELEERATELVDEYRIVADPAWTPEKPHHFGITIGNKHLLDQGIPAVVIFSTSGSALFDQNGEPGNEGNLLELAYATFAHPDQPIIYIESPGNGNSTDFLKEEYERAMENGKLVEETRNMAGVITGYEATETMQGLARALEHAGIPVSHLTANASGTHMATALSAALPKDTLERAFLYNPTNISDRASLALALGTFKEILTQKKYQRASKDPLYMTDERKEMARRVMGSVKKSKLAEARSSTHNPAKHRKQNAIFRRGNKHGQSAAVHAVVSEMRHKALLQTFVVPEFASQYKDADKDFAEFMRHVTELGGSVINLASLESLKIPLGQYGHSHYPTGRLTLENYAFNRQP